MTARPFFVPSPAPSAATLAGVAALLAACVLAFRFAAPTGTSLAAGAALIGLGLGIRLVTNAMLKKNALTCRDGLYAVCRHPMYVGTIIAAAGIGVALNHAAALALPGVAIAISLYRMRKEEDFLLASLPDYAEYRRAVPAFPTPASVARALAQGRVRQPFSLKQCYLNGEILRLNLYLPLLVAAGFYLQVPGALVAGGAVLCLLLAAASARLHPAESPRSRADYALPAVLAAAALALAAFGPAA